MPASRPIEERFWEKVDRRGPDDCWLWTAATVHPTGGRHIRPQVYGKIAARRGPAGEPRSYWTAHRLSWTLEHGDIPDGMLVDHACHNTLCVNPAHLRLVTPKQNSENRNGCDSSNTSGRRGVSWNRADEKWRAYYRDRGSMHHVGSFDHLDEAAEAVRQARLRVFTHSDMDLVP